MSIPRDHLVGIDRNRLPSLEGDASAPWLGPSEWTRSAKGMRSCIMTFKELIRTPLVGEIEEFPLSNRKDLALGKFYLQS